MPPKTPCPVQKLLISAAGLLILTGVFTGPAAAGTTLTPTLSIGGEFTDNAENAAGGGREDYITVVTPGLGLERREKTHDLRLTYRPGFTFYHRDPAKDTVRHSADAAFSLRIDRRTEVALSDSFTRTEEPRGNAGTEAQAAATFVDPTIRRRREPYSTNTASVNLNHRFGKKDSLGVGYTHYLLENDAPSLTDNQRHNPWARVSWWFTEHLGLDADVAYERGAFEAPEDDLDQYKGTVRLKQQLDKNVAWFARYSHTKADYDGTTADYTIWDPGVGFSWTMDKDTTLNFDVGYFIQERDGEEDETGVSFSGDIGRTWRIRRGSLRLGGESGYEETSFGAENLGLDIFYGLDAGGSYALTRQWTVTAEASYRRNKYVNLASRRRDDVYDFGAGLSYRPAAFRWLGVSLRYSHHDIDSSLDANDTTENRVSFGVSLIPVTPYRLD